MFSSISEVQVFVSRLGKLHGKVRRVGSSISAFSAFFLNIPVLFIVAFFRELFVWDSGYRYVPLSVRNGYLSII